MNVYRIMNRITKEWWEGEANSYQEACEKAGWRVGNCWVRVKYVSKNPYGGMSIGWRKPKEKEGVKK